MRILIVGAGVAGLTLAALLRQRGQQPTVIEREPSLADSGYMLGLYSLGSRVLHGLGLYDDFVSRSVTLIRYRIHNGRGKCFRDYSLQSINDRFGSVQGISRGDLIEVLLNSAGATPVLFKTTLQTLNQTNGQVEVQFSN